mmetsp:Transcript_26793/g.82886  ORF Transcript_26793/g.82886 Transcript_26793/m.82886 type:complete len:242 (+) Transcript_26793:629-1354(+)
MRLPRTWPSCWPKIQHDKLRTTFWPSGRAPMDGAGTKRCGSGRMHVRGTHTLGVVGSSRLSLTVPSTSSSMSHPRTPSLRYCGSRPTSCASWSRKALSGEISTGVPRCGSVRRRIMVTDWPSRPKRTAKRYAPSAISVLYTTRRLASTTSFLLKTRIHTSSPLLAGVPESVVLPLSQPLGPPVTYRFGSLPKPSSEPRGTMPTSMVLPSSSEMTKRISWKLPPRVQAKDLRSRSGRTAWVW